MGVHVCICVTMARVCSVRFFWLTCSVRFFHVDPKVVQSSRSSSVHEIVRTDVREHLTSEVKTDFEFEQVAKLDTRFFGELLTEVYRKNCDIHTCISEHVAKIRGRCERTFLLNRKAEKSVYPPQNPPNLNTVNKIGRIVKIP